MNSRPMPQAELIYGRNPVLEAARAGRLAGVLVATGMGQDARLEELRSRVGWREVSRSELDRMVRGVHQGVVGQLKPRVWRKLPELLAQKPSLLVALDGIEDPQNLGAVLRNAEAVGSDGAILPLRRSSQLTPAAIKASSGASEHLPLCRVPGLAAALPEVSKAGLWCVALDPAGDLLPWEFDFTQPSCLVIGGEGQGVHRLVLARCEVRIRLPMVGRVASFNAASATAAALYEVLRQRSS
ncbi:MAG: 23S rRNA (guanosine(2251)-2'-O)-methyltransferase RlmB [Candidatus Dormibacteraceae bacterium]